MVLLTFLIFIDAYFLVSGQGYSIAEYRFNQENRVPYQPAPMDEYNNGPMYDGDPPNEYPEGTLNGGYGEYQQYKPEEQRRLSGSEYQLQIKGQDNLRYPVKTGRPPVLYSPPIFRNTPKVTEKYYFKSQLKNGEVRIRQYTSQPPSTTTPPPPIETNGANLKEIKINVDVGQNVMVVNSASLASGVGVSSCQLPCFVKPIKNKKDLKKSRAGRNPCICPKTVILESPDVNNTYQTQEDQPRTLGTDISKNVHISELKTLNDPNLKDPKNIIRANVDHEQKLEKREETV